MSYPHIPHLPLGVHPLHEWMEERRPRKDDGEAPLEGTLGSTGLAAGFKGKAKLLGYLSSPLPLKPAVPPHAMLPLVHASSGPWHGSVMDLGSTQPPIYEEENPVHQLMRLKLQGTRKSCCGCSLLSAISLPNPTFSCPIYRVSRNHTIKQVTFSEADTHSPSSLHSS